MTGGLFVKRSVTLAGHRTSVTLEPAFWAEIDRAAERQGLPVARLIAEIDRRRSAEQPLSSALRLFVLDELRRASEPAS